MRTVALDETHVQQLLEQLLAHGYGELRVQVHNHTIASIAPMVLIKFPEEASGVHFGLTGVETRASFPR